MAKIYPVIMCGGSGTRMWPLSRQAKPKQYHALVSDKTMLQETLTRIAAAQGLDVAAPSFVCAKTDEAIIRSQCHELGIEPYKTILEPIGRNTAPVAAVIAQVIVTNDPDALILLLPADHYVADENGFWRAVEKGLFAANKGYITTLGIKPTHAETGYGYIKTASGLGSDVYEVARFVEKPDLETAQTYLASGDYFWNGGIFLFSCQAMISAFQEHAKDILQVTAKAIELAELENDTLHLDPDTFGQCRKESIDYAIMEKAEKVAIVAPVDIGWNDIGSWASLGDMMSARSNVGDEIALDCKNSYIHSDGPVIAAVGLENMIVVATPDAVLVIPADRAQEVKDIVEQLKATGRTDLL